MTKPSPTPRALALLSFAATVALTLVCGSARAAPSASRPPLPSWLSVSAFSRARADGTRDVGGAVLLGFALERVAQAPDRGDRHAWAEEERAAPLPEHVRPTPVSPLLARACVHAAWRAAGVAGTDAALDAVLSRARWAALLPEARVRATRYDDDRYYTDVRDGDAARARDTASSNLGLEGRLTWRLDRLLYADDEPALERIRSERRDARARIAGRALEALFQWRRAELQLRGAPEGSAEALEASLRLYEAEAVLDVLTDGWFDAHRPAIAAPSR